MGFSEREYQRDRNESLDRNFGQVYHTWANVRQYCKTKCRPIIHSDPEMTWCSVQSQLNHQLGRQLEIDPSLEATLVARYVTGHDNSLVFQFGGDGCGDNRYKMP